MFGRLCCCDSCEFLVNYVVVVLVNLENRVMQTMWSEMILVIFKLNVLITSWKIKEQCKPCRVIMIDSNIDDENIVGELVVHDKKLKLDDFDI